MAKGKILVIDDERNMRWVLERALTKAGYDVVTAERGEIGLQRFARHAVDLVATVGDEVEDEA